jgi:ankyrin repeat protein
MSDEPEDETRAATAEKTTSVSLDFNRLLIVRVYQGATRAVELSLGQGADVNYIDPESGLCPLHIAVGSNNLPLTRFLVDEANALFFPDRFGRWPTLIAAECEVDDELSDYIVEQEARFLEENRSS